VAKAASARRVSQVVGAGELARMYEKSRFWARAVLSRWYKEQQDGGEIRIIAHRDKRGRLVLETTIGALMRSMPPARDEALVRKVDGIDKDLDFIARRTERLVNDRDLFDRRLTKLESSWARLRLK
jgi:hypothetical protein